MPRRRNHLGRRHPPRPSVEATDRPPVLRPRRDSRPQRMRGISGEDEISIGLLWHASGAGNLGVGALTVGNLAAARAAAALRADAALHDPRVRRRLRRHLHRRARRRLFTINTRSMVSPSGFWSKLAGLDCVLDIGAGDSFRRHLWLKRFCSLWLSKELTYLEGLPCVEPADHRAVHPPAVHSPWPGG